MGLISRVSSRTYRNKSSNGTQPFQSNMPKTVNAVQDVDLSSFGDKVKMVVKGQTVTVTGPRGTLKRDFAHLKLEFKKTGAQSCRMTKWWSTNLEKANREVDMLPGVIISNSPKQKDEFWFEGNNVENVSRSCALVHQKAFVRNKDIRKFLDGVYVSQKTEIFKDNELLGIENK